MSEICDIHHDSDVVHCEECNVCVQGYEKHCMLAGKCIGKGNVLYYNLAIGMLPVYLIFFVLIAVT